jgi:sugar lactone lactonase YvrE
MKNGLKITAVTPQYAIPGGEIAIECEGFDAGGGAGSSVVAGGERCSIVGASSTHIIVNLPEAAAGGETAIHLESRGKTSEAVSLTIGRFLAGDMHIVANPAVDPSDGAVILTRSGSRGQQLPVTLFRLEPDGYLDEMPEPILNPTGIAFDSEGQMYVTNRAQGEVYAVGRDGTVSVYATGLGIATGIAFDADGLMYVGDRSGTVFRVRDLGEVETFTVLEPSVAAYHMAFGPDGKLYVTAPGLASHDAVHVVDREGFDETFFRGLGRPQGLAFDKRGDLYCAGCYQGRHGIVRITPSGSAEHFIAGNNVVGLCFTRDAEMIVATGDTVYSIECGIEGTLLTTT